MDRKIRDTIFFLMVFVLIFDYIPKPLQLNFLGGPAGNKLVVYPLLAGFLYSFYCHYKHGNVFVDFRKFARYAAVFVAVMLASTVVGLIMYPYYDLLLNGPVDQIEKLPRVLDFLTSHGIPVDGKFLMQCWIVARQVKGVFMEAFWCFGTAYLVYCWYKEDWKTAFRIAVKAVLGSFIVLLAYAVVEVAYLSGNATAKGILSTINPYIHPIVTNHGWWPPLLWKGQVRLVFPEPSHVGNFIAFGLPFLWYMYFSADRKRAGLALVVTALMSFLVFMTKARTAYAMLIGMAVLLFCLILLGRRYGLLKKFVVLMLAIGVGFGGFAGYKAAEQARVAQAAAAKAAVQASAAKAAAEKAKAASQKGEAKAAADKAAKKAKTAKAAADKAAAQMGADKAAAKALEENFLSLASDKNNKRSNGARYGLLKSHFRTGLAHPVLGVGRGLTGAYVAENFTPQEAKNGEISTWIRYQEERGLMAAGYSMPDAMNEYVSRFSASGILGLLVFLFPFGYVLWKILRVWRNRGQVEYMFMGFALISSMVAGCNGDLNLSFSVWLLLGLAYAAGFGKSREIG